MRSGPRGERVERTGIQDQVLGLQWNDGVRWAENRSLPRLVAVERLKLKKRAIRAQELLFRDPPGPLADEDPIARSGLVQRSLRWLK
jgi:hypothetical protein